MTQNQFYMAQIGAKREQWQAELAETARSHQAQEQISMLQYNESLRHNMAVEREQARTNAANEYINQFRNIETGRHNVESEAISRYSAESDNIIGNRNAKAAEVKALSYYDNAITNKRNADTSRRAQISQEQLGKASSDREERRLGSDLREAEYRNLERWSNVVNTSIRTASSTVKDIMGASGGLIKVIAGLI